MLIPGPQSCEIDVTSLAASIQMILMQRWVQPLTQLFTLFSPKATSLQLLPQQNTEQRPKKSRHRQHYHGSKKKATKHSHATSARMSLSKTFFNLTSGPPQVMNTKIVNAWATKLKRTLQTLAGPLLALTDLLSCVQMLRTSTYMAQSYEAVPKNSFLMSIWTRQSCRSKSNLFTCSLG